MKVIYSFFAFFIFISSSVVAQTSKGSSPSKVSEQKEMKATDHLKKELEQKQLSAAPERITGTNSSPQRADKRKNKKRKPGAPNDSSKRRL